jgi:hypothetical protein
MLNVWAVSLVRLILMLPAGLILAPSTATR